MAQRAPESAEEVRARLQASRAAGEAPLAELPWIARQDVRDECGVFHPLNPVYLVMAWFQPPGMPVALMCLGVRTSEEAAERLCGRVLEDDGDVTQFFTMRAGAWTSVPPRVRAADFHGRHAEVEEILRAALEGEEAALREMEEVRERALASERARAAEAE